MRRSHRERGLSEIVGFILILAAIVIAVALYGTFGIPAQGREGEISHMNDVRDRFVEFKVNLDSLWSNRQCGTAIGTSFTLGTGGAATTGAFSIIPIFSPAKSSATLALNQRAEYITIDQDSYFMTDDPAKSYSEAGSISPAGTSITFNTTPRYFFIIVSTPDLLQKQGVRVYPSSGTGWEAWVNITPITTFSRRFIIENGTGACCWNQIINFYEINETRWNRTDITVSTWNGGTQSLQDFTVYKNITSSPPTTYVVDLMNPAYGISTALGSATSLLARNDSTVRASYVTNYSYYAARPAATGTRMGSLEYHAKNEYWIPQTYYYQMGGVFLEQNEGNTVRVPPAVTFALTNNVPVVKINQIFLSGSGLLEGSGPVQVTSSVTSISDTQLAAGNNTKFVNITVDAQSQNAALMWLLALNSTADKAGFPKSYYKSGTSGLRTFMCVTSSDPAGYGVRLSLSKVYVNSAIQSAAPSGG